MRCKFENIIPPSGYLLSDKGNPIYHSVNQKQIANNTKRFILNHIIPMYNLKFKYTPNIQDVVGELTDKKFNLIKTSRGLGGYFDQFNNEIAYNPDNNHAFIDRTICHELAHYIQSETIGVEYKSDYISDFVVQEQMAETIAFFLYSWIFHEIDHKKFNSYYSTRDIKWLGSYYENKIFDIKFKNIT